MRLSDLKENDKQLDEILPALAAGAGMAARGAVAGAGAALRGGAALAKGVGNAVSQGVKAIGNVASKGVNVVGQAAQASGMAGGGMDPAQAAAAKKERDDQKKQVQDAIKAKQQELADLQKQLTQLG